MINLIRTTAENKDFIALVKQLDAYLKITDGSEHEFYNQFNAIETIKNVVIAYDNNNPIGCGAFKPFNDNAVEIKRMFIAPNKRRAGVGKLILEDLEDWAKLTGFSYCVLETGQRQVEAVEFYQKCNYLKIPNYGPYKNMENSICFKKQLN